MIRPRGDLLHTGFERSGRAASPGGSEQNEKMVERVRLRLSDDAGQWAEVLDAFVRMAAALRTSWGEPTDRVPGADAAIHWAGPDTTLVLEHTGGAVYLELVTNKRLSLDEELRQLDEEGLW